MREMKFARMLFVRRGLIAWMADVFPRSVMLPSPAPRIRFAGTTSARTRKYQYRPSLMIPMPGAQNRRDGGWNRRCREFWKNVNKNQYHCRCSDNCRPKGGLVGNVTPFGCLAMTLPLILSWAWARFHEVGIVFQTSSALASGNGKPITGAVLSREDGFRSRGAASSAQAKN